MKQKSVLILGTRGIPANYGGFETFAEAFAYYLAKKDDWRVTVYCQEVGKGPIYETEMDGIRLVHIPVRFDNHLGTLLFDIYSTFHAMKEDGVALVLGHDTGALCLLYRLIGKPCLLNMDGISWKRDKWGWPVKIFYRINEFIGAYSCHRMIADHPDLKTYFSKYISANKIEMITYGADPIHSANVEKIKALGLEPQQYCVVIARTEPENNTLEVVQAFSQKPRGVKLMMLGKFDPEVAYHKQVLDAASDEVIFPGPIYDRETVIALRYFSLIYIHGHTVGGTNPSLVESMSAGCTVLAHDNCFNRWVSADKAEYFSDEHSLSDGIERLIHDKSRREQMAKDLIARYEEEFTWDKINGEYQELVERYL